MRALAPAIAGQQTWALRDFHSPNLIWLPERIGIRRVGLLDFQDALIGPSAYFCKHPPQQFNDDTAAQMVEEYIADAALAAE